MKNITPEIIEKAKAAKSVEELLEIAKANNIEMIEDEAKTYFAQLNPKSGEIDDDDLDAVAGGGCKSKSSGRIIVTSGCKCFTGQYQLNASIPEDEFGRTSPLIRRNYFVRNDNFELRDTWCYFASRRTCGWCIHLGFENCTGVCEKS